MISLVVLKRCNTESHFINSKVLLMKCFKICFYSLDIVEFIECGVMLSRWQNNFDILFNFSEILALKIKNHSNSQFLFTQLL